ncbi:ABC transporter permease [Treponema primitia]|uniref:ABC transporter permease n=1 Tax=Treponema primitia TaxID=88058 RepID=UPI000C1FC668|nr:ABC transporter permease [Treponema primitia]
MVMRKIPARSLSNAGVWFLVLISPVALFGLFLAAQGVDAMGTYASMVRLTLFTGYGMGEVIIKTTPLIFIAVATCVSAKAGIVNVGGEGQFAMGALASTALGVSLGASLPAVAGIPLMALAGILGGLIWSGIAGLLKNHANMNSTITTLILNYIAVQVVSYFVFGLLKDPASFNWPMSPPIPNHLQLFKFGNSKVSITIFIALLTAVLVWLILGRTKWGFKIRVIGGNPMAALHAGYNVKKNQLIAMAISGGLCGFAGMLEMGSVEERLRQTTGVNYGYLGFLAAWMAWNNPLLSILTAFVIGFLSVSGNILEITSGLPSSSIRILMSVVLLAILWKGRKK